MHTKSFCFYFFLLAYSFVSYCQSEIEIQKVNVDQENNVLSIQLSFNTLQNLKEVNIQFWNVDNESSMVEIPFAFDPKHYYFLYDGEEVEVRRNSVVLPVELEKHKVSDWVKMSICTKDNQGKESEKIAISNE